MIVAIVAAWIVAALTVLLVYRWNRQRVARAARETYDDADDPDWLEAWRHG